MNVNSATPVPFGRGRGKAVNVPDHPPPPGYLCYRCREKGETIHVEFGSQGLTVMFV